MADTDRRGFSVHDEVVIDGTEISMPISMPISILESRLPETCKLLVGMAADKVLLQPISHVDFVLEQSIANWHFYQELSILRPDFWPSSNTPTAAYHCWRLWELESTKEIDSIMWIDTTVGVTLDMEYIIRST